MRSQRSFAAIDRRGFLRWTGVAGAGLGLASWPGSRAVAGSSAKHDVLVCLFLRGGLDGLSAVVPYQEALYYDRRPGIAIPARHVIDLGGGLGLHPALAPLAELYRAGELAVVHAVGHPATSRSHFEAQSRMERGVAAGQQLASGWIARHLATTPGPGRLALRAVALAATPPTSFWGAPDAISASDLAHLRVEGFEEPGVEFVLGRMHDPDAASGLAVSVSQTARDTLGALRTLRRAGVSSLLRLRPGYPDAPIGHSLAQAARLVRAREALGLEVVWIEAGGFDLHANAGSWQSGRLRTRLDELARGLHAFRAELDADPAVSVVVMSEFGRQLNENGAGGTDHGDAGCMLVMGRGIRGGVYGAWPGLAPAAHDAQAGVAVTTDFRDVLAELVATRLANPRLERVFPGLAHRPLGLAHAA